MAKLPKGANQHSSIDLTTQTDAAGLLNVSVPSIKRARKVLERATPEATVGTVRRELEETGQLAKLASSIGADGKERPREVELQTSQARAAELLNVSTRTVATAAKVKDEGDHPKMCQLAHLHMCPLQNCRPQPSVNPYLNCGNSAVGKLAVRSQRGMVAARLANMPSHRPTDKSANLQTSQARAAELLNVSTRTNWSLGATIV
jgi:hypothetical protein